MSFRARLFAPTLASAALLTAMLGTTSADACGGLFCSNNNQVNQAAERIIFAKNDDGTVTAAIEILYEGPAHEFAWVLPVPPGEISVGVSSKNALDRLDQQSNPVYRLNTQFDDGCAVPAIAGGFPTSGPVAAESDGNGGVQVVAEGNAGPYKWSQIMLDPALPNAGDIAVQWLEMNSYDVSKLGGDLLGGYLADGMNLVAFKLQKGKNAGSVRPVLLTYQGTQLMVPIKPTAVAANEDMGVKLWVLGDSRAIPTNYRHLEINEGLINWFNPNSNYNDVIIAAANEAGGHGFVTEQAGPAGAFADQMYSDFEKQNWNKLKTGMFTSKKEFLQTAQSLFGQYDGFQDVMSDPLVVPLRDGATAAQFMGCIDCYFQENVPVRNEAYPSTPYAGENDPIHTLDVLAFLGQMNDLVIEPMELTAQLFRDHAAVTRLYTTLSPDEMDVDPIFDFNAELPDVDNVHVAERTFQCNEKGRDWRIKLPQGMVIQGDGQVWPITTENFPANLRIIQLGTKGAGEVIEDNAKSIAALLTDLDIGNAMPELMDPPTGSKPAPDPTMVDPMAPDDPKFTDPEVQDDPKGVKPADKPADVDDTTAPGAIDDLMGDGASASDGGCSVKGRGAGNSSHLAWFSLLGLAFLRRRKN